MSRVLWVAAVDHIEAESIAADVGSGRLGHIEHYLSAEAAGRIADHLNRGAVKHGLDIRRSVFRVEQRAGHDGWIWVAGFLSQAGPVAAALLLILGGPFAVGFATLI